MTDQGRRYLCDILSAIELVESFVNDTDTFESYSSDLKTQSAVERQLGIIGEAVNKHDKLFPNDILINAQRIVGLRNRLIHAYDSVDNSIIWAIIQRHLSPLKQEVLDKMKNK